MNFQLLCDTDYFITPKLNMVARVENFNLYELLEWTKLFILKTPTIPTIDDESLTQPLVFSPHPSQLRDSTPIR